MCAIVILMQLNAVASLFVVGTKIEGFLCLMLAAFWAGTVAVVADSRHGLAVNEKVPYRTEICTTLAGPASSRR